MEISYPATFRSSSKKIVLSKNSFDSPKQEQPAVLGEPLLAQFGPCLPFLTKVDSRKSIELHPLLN